jgi:hypothetical protein
MKNEDETETRLSSLPSPTAEFIRLVIKKMWYRRKVRADVMAELAAHFEDELRDCTSDEEREEKAQRLVEEFGDAKLLAVLLRRAKKRCRPFWRTVAARTFQTACVLILCLVVYVIWFLSGKPNITVDYVAELNRIVRPTADESLNAAPLYNKAAELSKKPPIELFEFIKECKQAIGEEKWHRWDWLRRAYEWFSEHRDEYEDDDVKLSEWYPEQLLDGVMILLGEKHDQVTPEQKHLIEKWLDSNRQVFEVLIAGTQRPYYWPDYQSQSGDMMSVQIPLLATLRRSAYALRWRAWLKAGQGHYEDAFSEIKSIYRLGQHLRGDRILREQLVGIVIQILAIETLALILREYEIDANSLLKLQKSFEQMVDDEDFTVSIKFEKLAMYDEIQRCFTEDRIGSGHICLRDKFSRLQWLEGVSGTAYDYELDDNLLANSLHILFAHPNKNESREMVDRYFVFWNDVLDKTPTQIRAEGIDTKRQAADIIKSNILLEILAPDIGRINEMAHQSKAETEATLTIIAILRYRQDTGNYPERLDELITAGYLKEMPMDPWSDRPLVYRKTEDGFTLYSVGLNFIDDGGKLCRTDIGRPKPWVDEGDAVFWPVAK